LSDVGLTRANNQDSFVVALADDPKTWERQGHLFVVADGMGAHAAGELASKLAVETVHEQYRRLRLASPARALERAVQEANSLIYRRGQSCEDCRGMGTTISALALTPQGAMVAHVGDSRVYRLRDSRLEQLTFDHSLVWEVCQAEDLAYHEAPAYIPKNVITRSVGPHPTVQVDLEGPFACLPDDVFLLCSDGLSGLLEDREIGIVLGCLPPEKAARLLVDLALLRGGPDNITAIVVRVDGAVGSESEGQPDAPRVTQALVLPLAVVAVAVACAAIAMGAAGHPWAGLGVIAAAVIAAAAVAAEVYRWLQAGPSPVNGPLGKGPHTQTDSVPDQMFVGCLADTVQQLEDVAAEQNRSHEFAPLKEHYRRGDTAAEEGDFCGAIQAYGQAIAFAVGVLTRRK
jgi:protein phosphatase